MTDPAFLVHNFHFSIQPALLPEEDGTHRSSVVLPQPGNEQFIPR